MLSYRTIKMTDTLNFENISKLVRNELRQSYLRLRVRVEENNSYIQADKRQYSVTLLCYTNQTKKLYKNDDFYCNLTEFVV